MAAPPNHRAAPRPGAAAQPTDSSGRATLAMVAQAAGVSPSTVSRILNGTAKVNAVKEAAVRLAIEQLGFSPNPVARSLAGGRTASIGVLTQTVSIPAATRLKVSLVLDAGGAPIQTARTGV